MISYSNSDVGCQFNGSAIMGFVGSYFRDPDEQKQLIEFMDTFSKETNWPADTDRRRLLADWKSRHR